MLGNATGLSVDIPVMLTAFHRFVCKTRLFTYSSQMYLSEMAADRQAFTCQSQSFNKFKNKLELDEFMSMLIGDWKLKLKTPLYYLRIKEASSATSFGISHEQALQLNAPEASVEAPLMEQRCVDGACSI